MKDTMRYPIGTKFTRKTKRVTHEYTVVDYYVTRNLAGEIVKAVYVATHELNEQTITDRDISETTISMNLNTKEN